MSEALLTQLTHVKAWATWANTLKQQENLGDETYSLVTQALGQSDRKPALLDPSATPLAKYANSLGESRSCPKRFYDEIRSHD